MQVRILLNPQDFSKVFFLDINYPWLHPCGPSPYCRDVKEPSGTTVVDHPLKPKFLTIFCIAPKNVV